MKPLTKEELVDGLSLTHFSVEFHLGNPKPNIQFERKCVQVRSGLSCDPRCDVIISGSSCCTSNIVEIGGFEEGVDNVQFTLKSWGTAKLWGYCLPENKEEVVAKVTKTLIGQLVIFNKALKAKSEKIGDLLGDYFLENFEDEITLDHFINQQGYIEGLGHTKVGIYLTDNDKDKITNVITSGCAEKTKHRVRCVLNYATTLPSLEIFRRLSKSKGGHWSVCGAQCMAADIKEIRRLLIKG